MTASLASLDSFGSHIANVAMVATADFLRVEGLAPGDAAMKRITKALRASVKSTLSEALADGKDALDAGMTQVAIATVEASIRLAGIAAVKSVMCWSGCECSGCLE